MIQCKRCNAEIVWLRTRDGKNMPVNAPVPNPNVLFDHKIHVAHWATCPDAAEFRKKHPEPQKPISTLPVETEEQRLTRRCREKGIIK